MDREGMPWGRSLILLFLSGANPMKHVAGGLGLFLVVLVGCSSSSSPVTNVDAGDHDSGKHDAASDGHAHDTGTPGHPDAGHDANVADAPTTSDAALTAAGACADEANAVCALCESRTATACVNSLGAAGSGNSPAHVAACGAAYPSEACVDFFDGNPVTACVPPAGSLATGAACGVSAQCASTYCALTDTTVCGTCQALPVVGATCVVDADCGRDLACATPAAVGDAAAPTSGLCAAWVMTGGVCLTGYAPCQSGSVCVGEDEATMTMGVCTAAGATVGATCQTTRKTAPTCAADLGLVCIATQPVTNAMGTCQAIALVAAGSACGVIGTPATGFADCTAGGLCKRAAPTDLAGTCVAPAADGAACDSDPANGPPCLAPAKCIVASGSSGTAGTCTVPNATTCM
jgi:hypothetical protein